MKQKQLKVGLSEAARARLEAAASEAGHSVAEEIRQRLELSLREDTIRVDVLRLEAEIESLITLTEMQCGRHWNEHPPTARVLQLAINARLARYGARDGLRFAPGELPDIRLVAAGSDDPEAMAIGIEAVVHNKTDLSERFHALERHRRQQHERKAREEKIKELTAELAFVEHRISEAKTDIEKGRFENAKAALEAAMKNLKATNTPEGEDDAVTRLREALSETLGGEGFKRVKRIASDNQATRQPEKRRENDGK
jgi:hypothetical protein